MKSIMIDGVYYAIQDEVYYKIKGDEESLEQMTRHRNELKDWRAKERQMRYENEYKVKPEDIKSDLDTLNKKIEYCIENNFFREEGE